MQIHATIDLVFGLAMNRGQRARLAVTMAAPLFTASMRAYESETDLAVARAAAPALMKLIEGLLETAPNDRQLLEVVARGWAEFAFAFLEDDFESLPNDAAHADERARLTARATALYDRAFGFAARRLQDDDHDIERALAADVERSRRASTSSPRALCRASCSPAWPCPRPST